MSRNIQMEKDYPASKIYLVKKAEAPKENSVNASDYEDIVCFSHLRWNFVFQRPQHLLTNASRDHRIYYIEEPVFESLNNNSYTHVSCVNNITVITPCLPKRRQHLCNSSLLEALISFQLECLGVRKNYIAWYYTPMAVEYTRSLKPALIVYDCMDELSAFAGAPPGLRDNEAELMRKADIVFTGGRSLYESKKSRNPNVFLFPSSIDTRHYSSVHRPYVEPADQQQVGYPKIGFFGVLDERLDTELLGRIAELKPDWNFIMIGPVVKISPGDLPKRQNIHYFGKKEYSSLPEYIHSWDAAIMPFAKNESTQYISPTKVLEYLAAGKQVVSTSINDVVTPYGINDIVKIADDPEAFVSELEKIISSKQNAAWKKKVKSLLDGTSWSMTWDKMNSIIGLSLKKQKTHSGLKRSRMHV